MEKIKGGRYEGYFISTQLCLRNIQLQTTATQTIQELANALQRIRSATYSSITMDGQGQEIEKQLRTR
jgi:hypothetical protein